MKILAKSFIILFIPIIILANTRTVAKVHSGDLIEIKGGFTIHLLGITVPDKSTKMGYKVYDFVKRLIEGRVVKLFTYTTNNQASGVVYDKDGYAYGQIVYGEGPVSRDWSVNLNELLLKKGYARVNHDMLPDEVKHFVDLEKNARKKKIGIWKNIEK